MTELVDVKDWETQMQLSWDRRNRKVGQGVWNVNERDGRLAVSIRLLRDQRERQTYRGSWNRWIKSVQNVLLPHPAPQNRQPHAPFWVILGVFTDLFVLYGESLFSTLKINTRT